MKATIMLCDAVQVAAGKFFILGGGWSFIGPEPIPSALAVKIDIDWNEIESNHHWELFLSDEDGVPFTIPTPEGDQPVEVRGDFEAGRVEGAIPGSSISLPLAINIPPLPLEEGKRYVWRLVIDGETHEDWAVAFSVRSAEDEINESGPY